jgi:hypothetical protein
MLSKQTVMILGAGASMPYGFPSGRQLLRSAQTYKGPEQMAAYIKPPDRRGIRPLFDALQGTMDQSIDAMLETLPTTVVDAGKGFIARWLLNCEYRARMNQVRNDQQWHDYVWNALDLRSLEDFRASPITFITYNYDRSLERALYEGIKVKFPRASADQYCQAMDCMGPIHLHGQLGLFPELNAPPEHGEVPYGGGGISGPTESDCDFATRAIKIVHEPNPTDDAFMRARDAIGSAKRIIFLGFGYAKNNVDRLLLNTCLDTSAEVFLCATGFTEAQQNALIRPLFDGWGLTMGREEYDIVQFFRHVPQALL